MASPFLKNFFPAACPGTLLAFHLDSMMTFVPQAQPETLKQQILEGLSLPKKQIPCKFLYDETGSELFEKICKLKEYYLYRTELGILKTHTLEITKYIDPYSFLIEYGSGSSLKTRILLDHIIHLLNQPLTYIPIDISKSLLSSTTTALTKEYPKLIVIPIHADFTDPTTLLTLTQKSSPSRKIIFFPGSTFGNLDPKEAETLLVKTATFLGMGGRLLIGIDLTKEVSIMEAAYNDSQGVTASFNLNLLKRLNLETNANFQLDKFKHWAFFNSKGKRIEMHLLSLKDQWVDIDHNLFYFKKHETIHTENSYKYDLDHFKKLVQTCGFKPLNYWTDPKKFFSVFILEVDRVLQ